MVTRNTADPNTFDVSYGNTKEGFLRAKQKCLQDKDFESTVTGLSPLLLGKNIYGYLQKCEMTKLLSDDALKAMKEEAQRAKAAAEKASDDKKEKK